MLNPQSYLRLFLLFGLLFWQSCSAQTQLVEDQIATVTRENLRYYLYYPSEYDTQQDREFGLLLFLHGGGESGGNLEEIKENGPPKLLVEGKQFPFLVLAPQNPHKRRWWNTQAVKQLLDSVVAQNRIDPDKVYISGLSRGGSAAWEMATQYPDTFAAMAVICGMAPLPYAHWIRKDMPIWVFHGDRDKVISVEESDKMVAKLKQMKYNVKYTRYKDVGHDSWTRAYTTDSLYIWLNNQKRTQ
nr:PHB depolymerase family esterase [Allomuricauda sp.]